MERCYGVEMRPEPKKLPGAKAQLVSKTAQLAKVIDRDEQMVIVNSMDEAQALKTYYEDAHVFEELHALVRLDAFEPAERFWDYGFCSVSHSYYLFSELVLAFRMDGGNREDTSMFLFQLDEHLIGTESIEAKKYYFCEAAERELIEKYASAYNVAVAFFS